MNFFAEQRYNISKISDIQKSFICNLLKYRYIPHSNESFVNSRFTCETYDDVFMTLSLTSSRFYTT